METGCVDIYPEHREIEISCTQFEVIEAFIGFYNREVENLPLLF